MGQQFDFVPAPLVDLGLFCFKLDPSHWEARQHLGEKVMVGSAGGPWDEVRKREQVAAFKGTWENDVFESAGGFVGGRHHRGIGLQALVARTLGRYLSKDVRERMGTGTASLEGVTLEDSVINCMPVRHVMS
jgi:hypothetical protein